MDLTCISLRVETALYARNESIDHSVHYVYWLRDVANAVAPQGLFYQLGLLLLFEQNGHEILGLILCQQQLHLFSVVLNPHSVMVQHYGFQRTISYGFLGNMVRAYGPAP